MQLLRNGEWYYGRRWTLRAEAIRLSGAKLNTQMSDHERACSLDVLKAL
jgi:hypothetical protein